MYITINIRESFSNWIYVYPIGNYYMIRRKFYLQYFYDSCYEGNVRKQYDLPGNIGLFFIISYEILVFFINSKSN